MGETAAQTMKEIEETRSRLDADLRQLEGRLPAAAKLAKRAAAGLLGVGILGAMSRFAIRRRRRHDRDGRLRDVEKRLARLERDARD